MSQATVVDQQDQQFQPIPRCCSCHPDWPTLAQHIVNTFPELPLPTIARELRLAKDAIDTFDVGEDALEVAELIARHRLMLTTGAAVDVAKLDPQRHARRYRVAG